MAEVRLSPEARRDLTEIGDYGAEHFGEEIADSYSRGFNKTFARLETHPRSGEAWPELGRGTRSVLHEKHRVFYRVERSTVLILRVLHHAQDERSALKKFAR